MVTFAACSGGGLMMRTVDDRRYVVRDQARVSDVQRRVAAYYNSEKTISFYRDFWDAEHYHFGYYEVGMNPLDLRAMTENMTRKVVDRLGIGTLIPDDATILDLGCGIGGSARLIAQWYPKVRIVGVTLSERQVEIARDLSGADGLSDRIRYALDDFTALHLPAESFDGAFCIESACHAPDPDKADFLREAARILRPGGRLVVADGFRTRSDRLYPLLDRAYRFWCDGWRVPHLADVRRFARCMIRSRFEGVQVEDISWRVVPSMAYGVSKAAGLAAMLLATGQRRLMREHSQEWMVGFSAAFLGLNKHRFGYYRVSATRS